MMISQFNENVLHFLRLIDLPCTVYYYLTDKKSLIIEVATQLPEKAKVDVLFNYLIARFFFTAKVLNKDEAEYHISSEVFMTEIELVGLSNDWLEVLKDRKIRELTHDAS